MPVFVKLNKQKSLSTMSLYQNKDRELLNSYRICLKYVPNDVTSKDIERLCSKYGQVLDVTYSEKTPYKFVSFSSKSEMDRALDGLKNNQYGLQASPAKNNVDSDTASVTGSLLDCIIDDDEDEILFKENRFHRSASLTRDRNRNRPHNSHFSRYRNQKKSNQDSSSKENDHENDKRGLIENLKQSIQKNDSSPLSSAAAMKETNLKQCTTQFENKSDINKTDDDSNTKISSAANIDYTDGVVGDCVLCMKLGNKACNRCGDCYCSLECQRNDWQRHRYFCISMPSLIPLSRSDKSVYNNFHLSTQQSQQSVSDGSNINQILPPRTQYNKPPQQGAPIIAGNNGNFGNVMMSQRSLHMPQGPIQMQQWPMQMPQGPMQMSQAPMQMLQGPMQMSQGPMQMLQGPMQMPPGSHNTQRSLMHQRTTTQSFTPQHNYNNTNHDSRIASKQEVPVIKHIASTVESKNNNDKLSKVTSKKSIDESSSIEKDKLTAEKDDSKSNNDDVKQNDQNNSAKSDNTEQNENTNVKDPLNNKILATFPTSGSLIQIVSVSGPDKVYIRSIDTENDMQYLRCMNKINNESKNANNLTVLPKSGDLVSTKFENYGYCRAVVFSAINQNEITLLIIDYGVLEQKTLNDLKELSDEAKEYKRYVFPVHLKNLKNYENKLKEHKYKVMEYLDSYVQRFGKEIKIFYDYGDIKDNLYEVDLIDISFGTSLNKRVIDMLQ